MQDIKQIEMIINRICSLRFGSMADKQFKATVEHNISLAVEQEKAKRDNQVRSRIANIFASKYENEPRVSEKIERAVMNCFNDEDFEPRSDIIPNQQ